MTDATTATDPPRGRSSALPAPTGRDALWATAGGMGGTGVGLVLGLVPALLLGGTGYVAVGLATAVVGGAAGLWLALVRRRGWGWRQLGFVRGTRSLWHLLWEVPVALVACLVCTVLVGTLLGLAPAAGAEDGEDVVARTMTAAPWSVAVAVLSVVLLLPAIEEVVFRRVLLGWLCTRVPVPAAVLVVSALFAAVHVAPVAVLYLFPVGLCAALLFLWHRSLWAPVALHAVNNALASLVAVLALTR